MLRSAREVVAAARERAEDPAHVESAIVTAWSHESADNDRVSFATGFRLHERTGVEGLPFVVLGDRGPAAGGIVLRFGAEYPDSFERVDVRDGRHDITGVWEAFFERESSGLP